MTMIYSGRRSGLYGFVGQQLVCKFFYSPCAGTQRWWTDQTIDESG